jgi:hypothetical protein
MAEASGNHGREEQAKNSHCSSSRLNTFAGIPTGSSPFFTPGIHGLSQGTVVIYLVRYDLVGSVIGHLLLVEAVKEGGVAAFLGAIDNVFRSAHTQANSTEKTNFHSGPTSRVSTAKVMLPC